MTFSRRTVVRLAIALAAFTATFVIGWPLAALFVWLNTLVPWWVVLVAATVVTLLVFIIEDVTDLG